MTELFGLLTRRAATRITPDAGYAGDLTPSEAWALLREDGGVRLLDVRSRAEWDLAGRVPGALEVEYRSYPDWQPNPDFRHQVRSRLAGTRALLVLCRSGVRSREAAQVLGEAAAVPVFNVLEGFEGERNGEGQRVLNGWKAHGLPWFQA